MQFDELCAIVGALRDRVADLEAKVAVLAGTDGNRTQVVLSGADRWRPLGGSKPISVADRNRLR